MPTSFSFLLRASESVLETLKRSVRYHNFKMTDIIKHAVFSGKNSDGSGKGTGYFPSSDIPHRKDGLEKYEKLSEPVDKEQA